MARQQIGMISIPRDIILDALCGRTRMDRLPAGTTLQRVDYDPRFECYLVTVTGPSMPWHTSGNPIETVRVSWWADAEISEAARVG